MGLRRQPYGSEGMSKVTQDRLKRKNEEFPDTFVLCTLNRQGNLTVPRLLNQCLEENKATRDLVAGIPGSDLDVDAADMIKRLQFYLVVLMPQMLAGARSWGVLGLFGAVRLTSEGRGVRLSRGQEFRVERADTSLESIYRAGFRTA